MDCWHPIDVRAEKLDVTQRWAQLEGKSLTMRAELAQRYAARKSVRRVRLSNAAIYCEAIVVVLRAWWCFYGS